MTPYFYPAWAYGGIPRVAYELTRELSRLGHDVTVLTTDVLDRDSRYEAGKAVVDGVKVLYFRNLSNTLAYRYQVYLPRGFWGYIRENISSFDVIHLHGHRHFLNNVVRRYAARSGKPYVLSGHGTVPRIERRVLFKALFDRLLGDSVLRDASRLIAVSGAEVKQYEDAGVEEERITLVPNGIDSRAFGNLPESGLFRERYGLEGKRIILYLGKITPRKGVDFLVRAFSKLGDRDSVLVIAGNDMGFKNRVDEIIADEGVGKRVLYTGLLVDREKLSAYRDADVLVYPSTFEIFGLVPFEAMMCGTPAIVTDDCGCGEIIGKEDIGYTVKYNDIDGLKERIEYVLAHREEALKKVERGREFIGKRLSWEKVAKRHEEVYRSVM